MKNWLLRKFKEPSTWAGVIVALSPFLPWDLSIEQKSGIATALASVVGLLLIMTNESIKIKNEDEK